MMSEKGYGGKRARVLWGDPQSRSHVEAVATWFASSTLTAVIPAMVPVAIAAATSTKNIRFRKRASASIIVVSLVGWPTWRETRPWNDPVLMPRSPAVNALTAGASLWVFARIVPTLWLQDHRGERVPRLALPAAIQYVRTLTSAHRQGPRRHCPGERRGFFGSPVGTFRTQPRFRAFKRHPPAPRNTRGCLEKQPRPASPPVGASRFLSRSVVGGKGDQRHIHSTYSRTSSEKAT